MKELLSFAVTLNEKTLSEILASLQKIPFIQDESLDPSRIFFNKQGKIKVSIPFNEELQGIDKKRQGFSLEKLILTCVFGDFAAVFFEKKPEKPGRCVVFMSFLATLLTHPLEFLNIRLVLRAVSGLRTPNFVKYAVLLAKNEGISVFYRGFTANLLRNTAFNCIIFKKISHNFSIIS